MKKLQVINRTEVAYALRSNARKRAAFSPRAGRQAAGYNSAMSE
jgi:hypothetical protein